MASSLLSKLPPVVENSLRGLEKSLIPRGYYSLGSCSPPDWITIDGKPISVESKEQQDHITFSIQRAAREQRNNFMVADKTGTIDVSPPEPFQTIDFFVVGTEYLDEATVKCEFIDVESGAGTKTKQITSGYFSSGSFIPVSFSFDTAVEEATIIIESETSPPTVRERFFRLHHREKWKESADPWLSVPSPRFEGGKEHPILLISVDSFRYDHLNRFESVLQEMGDDVVIPDEPRTQGYVTNSSHASTFTGVHPSRHGYYGSKGGGISKHINPDLDTLPNLLSRKQYKCSGIGSQRKVGPEKGFGDGMHRFKILPMSWLGRQYDATDIANTTIEWIRRDTNYSSNRLFYFLHFWDAHYPYLPPQPSRMDVDLEMVDEYVSMRPGDYLEVLDEKLHSFPAEELELLKQYYHSSLTFISTQIRRILAELKRQNMFEDSFVIITGDHGEEFLERGFPMHRTLYDANVRPGMILKPPQSSSFEIPNTIDLIDIFPTISSLVGETIEHEPDGQSLLDSVDRPRITERHGKHWYNVAVEIEGVKGIFTFEYDFPRRPEQSYLDDGPARTEFYRLSDVRTGDFSECRPDTDLEERLHQEAMKFISQGDDYEQMFSEVTSSDVADRLEHLGYK